MTSRFVGVSWKAYPRECGRPVAVPTGVLVEREMDVAQHEVAIGRGRSPRQFLVDQAIDAGLYYEIRRDERLTPVVAHQCPFDQLA